MKLCLRLLSVIVCLLVAISSLSTICVVAKEDENEIIILFENDAHCAIDSYSKLLAMKNELKTEHNYVGVVSSGDFVQGDTLGSISKGEYIVNVMNMVGYDAVAPGNHEFDYKLERLFEISSSLNSDIVCSNFYKNGESSYVFKPYTIKTYGETDIAFVGVTTPDTLTNSSPTQFMDKDGNYIYNFCGNNLYDTVQKNIDDAIADGADYIIGLAHLGTENVYEQWSSQNLVKNTSGFDVVLDGHSHSIVEGMTVKDKSGNDVIISSTGTKFENIGKLTISDSGLKTELITVESYTNTDADIDAYIKQIREEYSELGDRVIGMNEVDLMFADENGNRLIRHTQTNLGDFCADAYRIVTGADIGVVNGGGIRVGLSKGELTFNDLLSIHPFNNTVCAAEVTGQQILDFLELSVSMYPEENGSFQHVSGLTYTLNTYIPSPVILDENMAFDRIEGERRVSDVKVLDKQSGTYKPIDPEKIYTLASHNYLLLDHGSGATMLNGSKIVLDNGMLDVELLEIYVTEHLGGTIGEQYKTAQNRVTIHTEPIKDNDHTKPDSDKNNSTTSPNTADTRIDEYIMVLSVSALMIIISLAKITKEEKYKD